MVFFFLFFILSLMHRTPFFSLQVVITTKELKNKQVLLKILHGIHVTSYLLRTVSSAISQIEMRKYWNRSVLEKKVNPSFSSSSLKTCFKSIQHTHTHIYLSSWLHECAQTNKLISFEFCLCNALPTMDAF